jgi:cation transport ATPase
MMLLSGDREAEVQYLADKVGISEACFGQNSDITAEAAAAVIMDPSPTKLDELIHIGRRMKRIALQSAVGGIAVSMFGMGLAAIGHLAPVTGAIRTGGHRRSCRVERRSSCGPGSAASRRYVVDDRRGRD